MTKEEAIRTLRGEIWICCAEKWKEAINIAINALEQEPQSFNWCTDCREYDQEKHCCHRYSRVIRDSVAELRQEN